MIVAIDGPAGVGKTTIARKLAEKKGFFFVSSGELYRALTLLVLKNGGLVRFRPDKILNLVKEAGLALSSEGQVLLSGKKLVSEQLHNEQIDSLVSSVAAASQVRKWVNQTLQDWSQGRDIVVEGRDMTTNVFPAAQLKVYLDAPLQERIKRRAKERLDMSPTELSKSIKSRDNQDLRNLNKAFSSTKDSLYINTFGLTILQVCETISHEIDKLTDG